jgi:iron complex outermembrane receptor protein
VRGPASSLHGEGALAGAVNYVRKEAYFDDAVSYDAVLQSGSHDSYRLAGGMNAPLADDRLAVRVDGVYSRQGSEVAGDKTRTLQLLGSARLAWAPNIVSTFKVDYFDAEREDAYWGTPVIYGRIAFQLSESELQ